MNKRLQSTSISADEATGQAQARDARGPKRSDSLSREEDRRLVAAAKAGDAEAFRDLFERYHRRAFGLALGVVKNRDDALDVVQDAFVKAHKHLAKFEGNSSFYTWLYRIVMNLSIDHLRRKKRARHVDFEDTIANRDGDESAAGDAAMLPRILGQNPGKALMRKEIREHINLALGELSDNHRAVLVMRELEGLSYQEMAEVMGCSKGTIMSRLFHARKNMQKRLLELMGGEGEEQ